MGRRAAPANEPWCLLFKVSFGVAQVVRVHESRAYLYTGKPHEWKVLVRDSEIPLMWSPVVEKLVSGTDRRAWLNEEDLARELDEDDDYAD